MPQFPHLTDTEGVRREAALQYGGLSDAAAFQQAHRATIDPNVEAAALRHRNADETAKVQNDLSLAQERIDEVHGEGEYRVIDAAVRGDALSAVVEDQYGRPSHLVVGWTDRWRSVAPKGPDAEARANAEAEAAKGRLGAEARAEVKRLVDQATSEIMARVSELFGSKIEDLHKIRDEAVQNAVEEDGERASGPVTKRSPSSTEGNDTSETGAGKTQGSETQGSGSGSGGEWPRRHDALDDLADEHGVSFEDLGPRATLDEKIERLQGAGVQPPEE